MWDVSQDTPYLRIDMSIVERNLTRMAELAHRHQVQLRPHAKTHKMPELGIRQRELGAVGLTVAKLTEAEVMWKSRLSPILVAYPLLGDAKAERLAHLLREGLEVMVATDGAGSLNLLEEVALRTEKEISVLLEVDTGFHRSGVLPGEATLTLARQAVDLPHLKFEGLMSFQGRLSGQYDPVVIQNLIEEDDRLLFQEAERIRGSGIPVSILSLGGTVLSYNMHAVRFATELRPGIYVFNDMGVVAAGAATPDDCAARVIATVVSRNESVRAVIDAGSKALALDGPVAHSYGHIVGHPDWRLSRLSEEHGVLECPAGDAPDPGTQVAVIPNHICPVVNLHSQVLLVSDDRVLQTLTVQARGMSR